MDKNIPNLYEKLEDVPTGNRVVKCSCGKVIDKFGRKNKSTPRYTVDDSCDKCKGNPNTIKVQTLEKVKPKDRFGKQPR